MNNVRSRLAGKARINSLAIGLTIIVVAMGTILFFQSLALNQLQAQSDQNNRIINQIQTLTKAQVKNAQQRTSQINELNRHLDCIVTFFSNPDRSQTAISDIDTCTVQDTKTGGTTTTNPNSIPTGTTNSSSSNGVSSSSTTPNTPASSTNPTTSGSTSPPSNSLGGTSNPSFLQQVVTPLNNNIVQPVKNLLNGIL